MIKTDRWKRLAWSSRVMVVLALLLAGRLPGPIDAARASQSSPPLSGAAAARPWLDPASGAWDAGFQFPGVDGDVSALVQDANGNIYLGGHFTHVGSQPISNVAKWNSATATWTAAGSIGGVRDLALAANGHLYAVGDMVGFAAMWNGSTWTALGAGLWSTTYAVAIDPASGDVYVGGCFLTDGTGTVTLNNLARWDGSTWSALDSGTNGCVYALAIDPVTSTLYVGGDFTAPASYVAKWTGFSWGPVGAGFNGSVRSLLWQGNMLYAGGDFLTDGTFSTPLSNTARWNGTAWSSVGAGLDAPVNALQIGSSGVLYAGGQFTAQAGGGTGLNHLAAWNGSTWAPLGSGTNDAVTALALDGAGRLVAGGRFTTAGGVSAHRIARWDGSSWASLGSGLDNSVLALAADGNTAVFAGGSFTAAGDVAASHIARWVNAAPTPTATSTSTPTHTPTAVGLADFAGGDVPTPIGPLWLLVLPALGSAWFVVRRRVWGR